MGPNRVSFYEVGPAAEKFEKHWVEQLSKLQLGEAAGRVQEAESPHLHHPSTIGGCSPCRKATIFIVLEHVAKELLIPAL